MQVLNSPHSTAIQIIVLLSNLRANLKKFQVKFYLEIWINFINITDLEFSFNEGTCVCAKNTYENASGECKSCPNKCKGCNKDLICDRCSDVVTRTIFNLPKCSCSAGYYDDGVNAKCPKCPNGCSKLSWIKFSLLKNYF